jgi:hypothetical protein
MKTSDWESYALKTWSREVIAVLAKHCAYTSLVENSENPSMHCS